MFSSLFLNSVNTHFGVSDNRVEIREPHAGEESVEPEPEERTMAVSKLTEGLRLTEAGIKVFGDIDSNEQRAADY
jgi:hypothetical protein